LPNSLGQEGRSPTGHQTSPNEPNYRAFRLISHSHRPGQIPSRCRGTRLSHGHVLCSSSRPARLLHLQPHATYMLPATSSSSPRRASRATSQSSPPPSSSTKPPLKSFQCRPRPPCIEVWLGARVIVRARAPVGASRLTHPTPAAIYGRPPLPFLFHPRTFNPPTSFIALVLHVVTHHNLTSKLLCTVRSCTTGVQRL
jgi:hypothetical protein